MVASSIMGDIFTAMSVASLRKEVKELKDLVALLVKHINEHTHPESQMGTTSYPSKEFKP